jgi:hypothetical protein
MKIRDPLLCAALMLAGAHSVTAQTAVAEATGDGDAAPTAQTADADEAPRISDPTAVDPGSEMILAAPETALEDWQWLRRPLVVFADSPADPRYVQQMEFITDRLDALEERDVIVITDTDPSAGSSVRETLRPRGFMLVVMAKDGTIVARKPRPWSVREIGRSIDKLPLRQQEVRDRRQTEN